MTTIYYQYTYIHIIRSRAYLKFKQNISKHKPTHPLAGPVP